MFEEYRAAKPPALAALTATEYDPAAVAMYLQENMTISPKYRRESSEDGSIDGLTSHDQEK
jgi:hypothetical protein